jgi:RNA:NAD 2'-phosphotransferase (TPT1/KptA family)
MSKKETSRVDRISELVNFALNNPIIFSLHSDKGGWVSIANLIDKLSENYNINKADISNIIERNETTKYFDFVKRSFIKSIKNTDVNLDSFVDLKLKG